MLSEVAILTRRTRALPQLFFHARTLPGPRSAVAFPLRPLAQLALPPAPGADEPPVEPVAAATWERRGTRPEETVMVAELRRETRDRLLLLATRIEAVLPAALEKARKAWDAADAVAVYDEALRSKLGDTRRKLRAALSDISKTVRAAALESFLALDAACGLADLVERRLAALIRLRLRSQGHAHVNGGGDDRSLVVDGRPFLDVGRALGELARSFV